MSKLDKMLAVGTLRELRFPLPFNRELEFSLYNALLTSYRARKQMKSDNSRIELTIDNISKMTNLILSGDSSEATNAGFSLIGYSGCGKSSAISNLVNYYPQVIIHTDENGAISLRLHILWLTVFQTVTFPPCMKVLETL